MVYDEKWLLDDWDDDDGKKLRPVKNGDFLDLVFITLLHDNTHLFYAVIPRPQQPTARGFCHVSLSYHFFFLRRCAVSC